MQRKWVLKNGFHEKWVWDENAQNMMIQRNINRDGWGRVEKLRKVFFSEKEWWNEEEKSRGRRRWMVPMEEEKLMEHEAKKQKERNNEVGGQNFGPHTL